MQADCRFVYKITSGFVNLSQKLFGVNIIMNSWTKLSTLSVIRLLPSPAVFTNFFWVSLRQPARIGEAINRMERERDSQWEWEPHWENHRNGNKTPTWEWEFWESTPHRLNSWPTFSRYLYNRVWSELTCCNSLSHSRLACSRLSAHIQPSVNNQRRQTRPIHGHELS